MLTANPKVAALPVMVVAMAAVQLGAAFLAISVQQSTGARLDRFLDGLVIVTLLWAVVVLFELFAFPDQNKSNLVAGPALTITAVIAILIVIFRAVEGVMGHSLGLRYAVGQFGYVCSMVWAGASLWFLVAERFGLQRPNTATTLDEQEMQDAGSGVQSIDVVEPEHVGDSEATPDPVAEPLTRRQSAFSAALLEEPDD